eukprot:COSAG01_NODE_31728_length_592_cov_1.196755_1_plen_97_part_00
MAKVNRSQHGPTQRWQRPAHIEEHEAAAVAVHRVEGAQRVLAGGAHLDAPKHTRTAAHTHRPRRSRNANADTDTANDINNDNSRRISNATQCNASG